MEDLKEEILKEIQMRSVGTFSNEQISRIAGIVSIALYKYNVTLKCEELSTEVVRSNEWYIKQFLAIKSVAGLSARTIQHYRNTLNMFFRYVTKNVEDITTNDIRVFLAQKANEGVAITTLNNYLRPVSSFFATLQIEEYLDKNPAIKLTKIKEEKKVKQPFSGEEIEKMRDFQRNNKRNKFIIEFLLSTGCRISEASKANIKDLDGDRLLITGKGNKQRYVYLNTKAIYAFNEYMKTRTDSNPAMFVSLDEPFDRLEISGFEIVIREMGKALGIERCHPHKFRRTVATTAMKNGMPIEQVSLMLGHENVTTTQIYARSEEADIHEAHRRYVR